MFARRIGRSSREPLRSGFLSCSYFGGNEERRVELFRDFDVVFS